MAKGENAQDAEDRTQGEADPDILAIRALMSEQEADIAVRSSAPVTVQPLVETSAGGPASAPPAPLQEIEAAISMMVKDAEQDVPADTRLCRENHQPPSGAQAVGGDDQAPQKAPLTRFLSLLGTFAWQVLRHPKTPRVALILLLLTALYLRPILITILVLCLILTAAVIYVSVGPEAVDDYILRRFEALKKRNPERADQLRRRAILGISVLNKMVDRLPERWTAGLYLPDLEEPAAPPERMQDDPFERLKPVAGGQPVIRRASPSAENMLLPDPRKRKANPEAGARRPPRQIRP